MDVAVLPGGMTAVVGQTNDFGLRHVDCFSLWTRCPRPLPDRTAAVPERVLGRRRGDAVLVVLDATAGSNGFVTSMAANGWPIVYVAMTTEDGALGTPGALQSSISGGADAMIQAIDLSGLTAVSDPPRWSSRRPW